VRREGPPSCAIYGRAAVSLNSARGFDKHPGKNVTRRSTHSVSERTSPCGLVGCAGWVKFFPGIVRPVEANHSYMDSSHK